MSALMMVLFACGGSPAAPKAPEAKLEDYMRTCMGAGDCVVVATGCCSEGSVAVNKSSVQHVRSQALPTEECAKVQCTNTTPPPTATCESAKCVLAH